MSSKKEAIYPSSIPEAVPILEPVSLSLYPAQEGALLLKMRKTSYPQSSPAAYCGPIQEDEDGDEIDNDEDNNDENSVSSSPLMPSATTHSAHSSKKKVRSSKLKKETGPQNNRDQSGICKFFSETGRCTKGNACAFKHISQKPDRSAKKNKFTQNIDATTNSSQQDSDDDLNSISSSLSKKATLSRTSKKNPCYSMLASNGRCRNGPECEYDHDIIVPDLKEGKVGFCRSFFTTGSCKFGYNCKNDHVTIDEVRPMQKKSASSKKPPCFSMLANNGRCRNGPDCDYDHDIIIPELKEGKAGFCRSFFTTGSCNYGYNCKNDHVTIDEVRPKSESLSKKHTPANIQPPKNKNERNTSQSEKKKNGSHQRSQGTSDGMDDNSVSSLMEKKPVLSRSTKNKPKNISFSTEETYEEIEQSPSSQKTIGLQEKQGKNGICEQFLLCGRCAKGNKCEFKHVSMDQTKDRDRINYKPALILPDTAPQAVKNNKITSGRNKSMKDSHQSCQEQNDDADNMSVSSLQSLKPAPSNGFKKRPCFSMLSNQGKCKKGLGCEYDHDIIVPPLKEGKDGFCMTFVSFGNCKDGDKCRYDHASIDQMRPKSEKPLREPKAKTELCRFFAKGKCNNGDDCLYRHEMPPTPSTDTGVDNPPIPLAEPSIINDAVLQDMKDRVAEIEEERRKALTVDLVIVMDCTGSMASWIDAAKTQVHHIIDQVKSKFAKSTVNVGFVAYRDFDVKDYRAERIPLTTDIDSVRAFIDKQKAYGGGDGPEDIPGGLKVALEMNWWGGSRCIVLVTDAPCHGKKYNDTGDSYPDGHPGDPNIEDQMRGMATKGIDFMVIDVQPIATAKMIKLLYTAFETAPLPEDGERRSFTVVPLAKSKVEATEAAEKLLNSVFQMVSKSVMASCSRTESKLKSVAKSVKSSVAPSINIPTIREDEEDHDDEPDENADGKIRVIEPQWSKLDDISHSSKRAVRHTLWLDPKKLKNWDNLDSCIQHVQQHTQIKIMRQPFSEGAMRTAHCLEDMNIGGKKLVAKVFKSKTKQGKIDYHNEVKLQCISRALAKLFSLRSPVGVDFIAVSYYEVLVFPEDDPLRFFGAEPFLTGEFRKYNNNAGWVSNTDAAGLSDPSAAAFALAAQAFSHFTWEHTGGKLHVVDLQGVDNILTDPQIHSVDGRGFGSGDIGVAGSARFFASHVCNEYCRALGLNPLKHDEGEASLAAAPSAPEKVHVSCDLYCGTTFPVEQRKYCDELRANREMYCDDCTILKSRMTENECEKCNVNFKYSAYWYQMKGMEEPKMCPKCRKEPNNFKDKK